MREIDQKCVCVCMRTRVLVSWGVCFEGTVAAIANSKNYAVAVFLFCFFALISP